MKAFEQAITAYAKAMEAGKPEEAQGAAFEALALAAEEAESHPTPGVQLKSHAADCEMRRDWARAEAAYRDILLIEEATGNQGLIAKAHMDLSRVLRLLGRLQEASQFASSAVTAARQASCFPMLVMALEHRLACDLASSELQEALQAATEMVQVIEPGRMYNSMRARALICLAGCLIATGDLTGAESNLSASWDLLHAPGALRNLPGPMYAQANWWEERSRLLEQRGEIKAARTAITECIEIRRQNCSPNGTLALIRALEKFAELSENAEDPDTAATASNEATQLREELQLPAIG